MWVSGENNRRVQSWAHSLIQQHFGDRRACWSSEMGTRKSEKHQSFTRTCTNQTTSWLVHSFSTFGVRTSHMKTRTHKTHHSPDLGEATTFPLYSIFCGWPWDQHPNVILSWDSQVGVSKFSQLQFSQFWGP
jgi:hypothetical protein